MLCRHSSSVMPKYKCFNSCHRIIMHWFPVYEVVYITHISAMLTSAPCRTQAIEARCTTNCIMLSIQTIGLQSLACYEDTDRPCHRINFVTVLQPNSASRKPGKRRRATLIIFDMEQCR